MKSLASNQRGQVFALTAVVITACLAMSAFVLDVGSWFREHRHTQRISDAAALAGAQELPSTANATTFALQYSDKNDGGVAPGDITFETKYLTNDTISVTAHRTASGFFSNIFGIGTVNLTAHAKARAGIPSAARYVAPIAVNRLHPMLQPPCNPICTDDTTITLANLHISGGGDASGAFALLDLDGDQGTAGESTLADWMAHGYSELMPLGTYYSDTGTKFNGGAFEDALSSMIGHEVLFPVYMPPVVESGQNAEFNIVGWVGFYIDSYEGGGNGRRISGHFTQYIAQGIQGGSGGLDLGVRVVALVE
jgi:Putative Flp pilus-assembly TadE/G-like